MYDEDECGDLTGTLRIHDNVVVNQVGAGIAVGSGGSTDPCFTMDVEIYNNLLVNVGLAPFDDAALAMHGTNTRSHARIYNNTIVGWQGTAAIRNDSGGTWEYRNNIVADSHDLAFWRGELAPDASESNLWWGPSGTLTPPDWDNSPVTSDPLFFDAQAGAYHLQAGSPAIDTGADVSSVVIPMVSEDGFSRLLCRRCGAPTPILARSHRGEHEFADTPSEASQAYQRGELELGIT